MLVHVQPKFDLFGIPLPSDNIWFVIFVIIHILLSFSAVITGLVAMLREKTSTTHSRYGRIYFWSVASAFGTVIVLAVMRWPHNNHLFLIGFFTTIFVMIGRRLVRHKPIGWAKFHTICMGASYILLLTGFYVDNGEHLPFWDRFPQWSFYVFPSLVGIPIIIRVLKKHPLTKN